MNEQKKTLSIYGSFSFHLHRSYSAHNRKYYYGSFNSLACFSQHFGVVQRFHTFFICLVADWCCCFTLIFFCFCSAFMASDIFRQPNRMENDWYHAAEIHAVAHRFDSRCVHLHERQRKKSNYFIDRVIVGIKTKTKQIDLKSPKLNPFWNMVQLKLSKQMLHIHGLRRPI